MYFYIKSTLCVFVYVFMWRGRREGDKKRKQCILSHRKLDTVQSPSDYLLLTVRSGLIVNLFCAF